MTVSSMVLLSGWQDVVMRIHSLVDLKKQREKPDQVSTGIEFWIRRHLQLFRFFDRHKNNPMVVPSGYSLRLLLKKN
jgi:hypothetical protein